MMQEIQFEEAKTMISSFQEYKEMLSVSEFLFRGEEFRIYGNNENPLFLVNDIVCDLLGMDRPSDNRFFKDHKTDSRYVNRGQFAHSPKELQERFKNSKKDHIYFFTEKGLYKCLMRSNKPIAEFFQDEICDILKNIRLGLVSVHIERADLLEQQLKESQSNTEQFLITIQQKESLIADQNTKLEKIERRLSIYEAHDKTTGKSYVGSSYDFERRVEQHKRCSSNKELREAFSLGHNIEIKLIGEHDICTEDDRKSIERQAIESFPKNKLMNIEIPRPDLSRVTIPETPVLNPDSRDEEEIKDNLSIVNESVRICPNCRRSMSDSDTVECAACLESIKKSKVKRSQEILADDKLFCPRCACVRDKSEFAKTTPGASFKTCIKCRERNVKTTKTIQSHNNEHPDEKMCTLCHKPNSNPTAQCETCLDKKKANRKYCEHDRLFNQCGEGDCINNARNMCKTHRVRNPCAECKITSE